ncbi:transposase, partial [bacterium]|nr:transposase [bacterium]
MSDENRYHRQSIRLKSHDYSQMGYYFLTIVVQDHISVFGNIENGIVVYNELGKFVQKCWMEIPSHFPEIKLHQYIIMPNHIHGILQITNNNL